MNRAALDFLSRRRSSGGLNLIAPGPSEAELEAIITAGLRVPDHGALTPWRLLVCEGAALTRLADAIYEGAAARGIAPEKATKTRQVFGQIPLMIAVVNAPKESHIPHWEQELSAGALCLSLVNASLASGYGATWVTNWMARDTAFCADHLGLSAAETIAGFILIGTPKTPPTDRPRPDLSHIVTRVKS